jgi:hypothetical protein
MQNKLEKIKFNPVPTQIKGAGVLITADKCLGG